MRALSGQGGGRRAGGGVGPVLPRGPCRARVQRRASGSRRSGGAVTRMAGADDGPDQWYATSQPDAVGHWTFTVEAFSDPYLSWRDAVVKKIDAGQGAEDLANDLEEGAGILEAAVKIVPPESQAQVQ